MDGVDRNRQGKSERGRERERATGRWGRRLRDREVVASGAGTWRVNASTSKWLAGTIIALNALSSGRAAVHPHANRGDKTHAPRARGRVHPGRRKSAVYYILSRLTGRTLIWKSRRPPRRGGRESRFRISYPGCAACGLCANVQARLMRFWCTLVLLPSFLSLSPFLTSSFTFPRRRHVAFLRRFTTLEMLRCRGIKIFARCSSENRTHET